MMYRLGIDAGGTFTDAVLWSSDDGVMGICKVPSDRENPSNAVYKAACRVCSQCKVDIRDVDDLVHGTTVATNVSLEKNGPRIGLLTTKGFRDVLEIGRLTRPASALYDLMDPGDAPLVARRDRFEVDERIGSDGGVIHAVNREDIEEAVLTARKRGIKSLAVCFLFSFLNPTHEIEVRRIIKQVAPEMSVSLSSEILPQVREYERTSAAVINAYLQPVCGPYLNALEKKFEDGGASLRIWVMQSNGGVTTPQHAAEYPINLLMSGPSGGVVAVKKIASDLDLGDVISVDMGGTSFDVSCVTNGDVSLTSAGDALGMPLRIPTVDISTIGTGGGSIAFADVAHQLHVGPTSAGARPGPSCYGLGGVDPTVTDANVTIGYIPDHEKLGHEVVISRLLACKACEPLAESLGMSPVGLAQGIRKISTASMAGAVRAISVGRGRDPRSFTMVAFGGAGPLHAVDIARAMGIGKVVIPRSAGVLSALGLVGSDVVRTFTRSMAGFAGDRDHLFQLVNELASDADELDGQLPEGPNRVRYVFDVRYSGQNSTIPVTVQNPLSNEILQDVAAEFGREHFRLNGYRDDEMDIRIDAVNLVYSKTIADVGRLSGQLQETEKGSLQPSGVRELWIADSETVSVPVYDLDALEHGGNVESPCVIVSSDTTVVVPKEVKCRIDAGGNVIIEIRG